MSDSQYAIFHFDVKSIVMVEGELLIFNSLPNAERHCQENINANPALGCRILDHNGKTVRTLSGNQVYDRITDGLPQSEMHCWVRCYSWPE